MFYDSTRWSEAVKYCRACPIVAQCRIEFIGDPHAFAGGMSPTQRAAWVQRSEDLRLRRIQTEQRHAKALESVTAVSPSRFQPMDPEKKAEILRIFDTELVGPTEIGRRVGAAKSTVQRICRENGRSRTEEQRLELSRRGGLSGGQKALGERNADMTMKLLADGYKPKEVAEMVGITFGHVYLIRRRYALAQRGNYSADVLAKMTGLTERAILKIWEKYDD